jgi:hypothetical protein
MIYYTFLREHLVTKTIDRGPKLPDETQRLAQKKKNLALTNIKDNAGLKQ